jgi:hypothetical protein
MGAYGSGSSKQILDGFNCDRPLRPQRRPVATTNVDAPL